MAPRPITPGTVAVLVTARPGADIGTGNGGFRPAGFLLPAAGLPATLARAMRR